MHLRNRYTNVQITNFFVTVEDDSYNLHGKPFIRHDIYSYILSVKKGATILQLTGFLNSFTGRLSC